MVKHDPKPVVRAVHKRRSEEDMRKALQDFVDQKPRYHDDDREVVLSDAITEVVELRRIVIKVTQTLTSLQTDVSNSVKGILSPQ